MPEPWEDLADFLEAEQQLILAEQTERMAKNELKTLLEIGEPNRAKAVCTEILATIRMRETDA